MLSFFVRRTGSPIPSSLGRSFSAKSTIPIIDINEFKKSPQTVATQMYDACNYGVFYCTGHGIRNSTCTDLLKQSQNFFNLPLDEKLKIHVSKGGIPWRGYMPFGGEQTHGNIDRKEGLYLGLDHDASHHRVASNTPLFGMNQFPSNNLLPDLCNFRETVNEYIHETIQFGNTLTNLISCSLKLEASYIFENYIMNEPIAILRLWKYPKSDVETQSGDCLGIGKHTDYGLLTILKSSTDGLQFKLPIASSKNEDGELEWIDIPPMKDAFVVSVGDLLDRISYGRFKSREHRVITQRDKDRYTSVLFYDPSWDCNMQYLPLMDKEMNELHQVEAEERWRKTAYKELGGKYSDFLAQKVKKVFPDLLSDYEFEYARAESTRFQISVSR